MSRGLFTVRSYTPVFGDRLLYRYFSVITAIVRFTICTAFSLVKDNGQTDKIIQTRITVNYLRGEYSCFCYEL